MRAQYTEMTRQRRCCSCGKPIRKGHEAMIFSNALIGTKRKATLYCHVEPCAAEALDQLDYSLLALRSGQGREVE